VVIGIEDAVVIATAEFTRLFAGWPEDWEHWGGVTFHMSFTDRVLESAISSIRQDNPQAIPIWSGLVSTNIRSLYETPAFSFIINAETGRLIMISYAPITQRFDPISGIDDLFVNTFDSAVVSVWGLDEDDFIFRVTYASGEQATFGFMSMDEEWAAVMYVVIEFLD